MRKQYVTAFVCLGLFGGLSIFTLPLRNPVQPAPEVVTAPDIDLDELLREKEEEAEARKLYLDSLLETAECVREPQILPILTEEAIETTESYILSSEEETTGIEAYTKDSLEETEAFIPVPCMMDPDLQEWVFEYCYSQAVSPYVVIAVCERESGCTPAIMGDSGRAYGIMQIQIQWIPEKLEEHGYTACDMLEAEPNIVIGVEILKHYLSSGNGLEWALMAYNGGQDQAGSAVTREYAQWVLQRADDLRRAHNGEA